MLTVSEGFALYLSKRALAESSVEVKTRAKRLFIEAIGDLPVKSVSFAEAEDYKMWLAKSRSVASANIYLANLKPYFGWLKMRGHIDQDPFATITLFETEHKRREVFGPAEIERILRVADLRWQMITLLGLCSLRRSEVLNLTVDDINWQGGYIRITPKADSQTTWQWAIKNHRAAIVPMPEIFTLPDMIVNLHNLLRELITELPIGQPYVCVQPETYERLLMMKSVGGLTWKWRNCPWQNFTRDWLRILKRAAVNRRCFKALRATMPTEMSQRGVPIKDVQQLLRHKSIQTTAEYYIATDERRLIQTTAEIASKFYVSNVS